MDIKSTTGKICGDIVGGYELKFSDQVNLEFMGWDDKCFQWWMSVITSKWMKR